MTLEKRLPNDSPTLTVQSNQIEEKGSSQSYVGFYLWQTRRVYEQHFQIMILHLQVVRKRTVIVTYAFSLLEIEQ